MEKTITYFYPDKRKAAYLKVFQDRTNQIKAFYFTKENTKDIEKLESATNYAIYFLFDNSDSDNKKIYIGQSINGIKRIFEHINKKDFWSYCILFVTDNNSFDKLTIDYMEYEFIKRFRKSSFTLMNKDPRTNEPNVSMYDKPNILSYIEQIEFLLSAEGISLEEPPTTKINEKFYYPKNKNFRAAIFINDGKFVLAKGSELHRPVETSAQWKTGNFFTRYNDVIDSYIEDGKAIEESGILKTTLDMSFNSPSRVAELISGQSTNGWWFFEGLNELRTMDQK
ncbi:GIY-YIG nuclease family protein [Aerococcus urinaeequi]|uniref:GIY-YIG nuclease family protein n=1 Tax=Aerococcus urinaeequi TaxID=51665 RepID=UPI003B3A4050